jgi:MraZ protein
MLIGQYLVKLTEKNRTALPKKFRDELGGKIIIARWYEGCLVIVSDKDWTGLLTKLTGISQLITQPVRDTDRFILGSAFEIELDDQGRFVIPKILKDYAALGIEVVFVGLGNRVEIWNTENWRRRETYIQKNAAAMIEKVSNESTKSRRDKDTSTGNGNGGS